jgi:hypothetical protein
MAVLAAFHKNLLRLGRSDNTDQLLLQRQMSPNGFVNTGGQCYRIFVPRANDDAAVRRVVAVQAEEVASIECDNGAPVRGCKRKHSVVGSPAVSLTLFLYRRYVMAEAAQFLDDGVVEILVGVEARHPLQGSALS